MGSRLLRRRPALGAVGALLAALLGLGAGCRCVTPPPPLPEYAQAAYEAQLAACAGGAEGPVTLPPEPGLDGEHPLDFYVVTALERNPELLAAAHRVTAQVERIPQVTALDDPMLQDTFWPITAHSPQTASGRMPNSLMLTQQFPWLAKLRVRGEVEEQEAKIALTQLAQEQLRVTEEVQLAYYELFYNQQAVEITKANRELLEDLRQFAEARYRTGGSQQDVLRAQLELDRIEDQLIRVRRQLQLTQADMAALLHTSPEARPLSLDEVHLDDVPGQIEQLYQVAVHCRPELQERLHAIVRDERRRKLACLEYYPDLTVGVSWDLMTTEGAIAPSADGKDNLGVIVGVTLPIWRDRLRAGIREAEHRAVEDARRYDAERDETFRQIRRLIAQADAAEQQIALYSERIIPRAEQTLRVSVAEYRVGKVDFLQVVNNWTELLSFRVQLARLRADLGQSLASLERVIGCQLAALPEPHQPAHGPSLPTQPAPAPTLESDEDEVPMPDGAPEQVPEEPGRMIWVLPSDGAGDRRKS